MLKPKKGLIALLALLYVFATSFFIWGLAVGKNEIFPWKQLAPIYNELYAYFTFQEAPKKTPKEKMMLHHQEYRTNYDFGGFRVRDNEFNDDGYLLISAFNKKYNQVLVEFFSIAENRVIHTWIPPVNEILELTPNFTTGPNTVVGYRAMHPLLLDDGGLVFTSGAGPMVRLNACGEIVWVLEHRFHHSIERDHSGNFVTCSKLDGDGPGTTFPIRDDGVAVVSPEGKIIEEYSITKHLLENGYQWLLYGIGRFEKDRIHLNDAHPIVNNAKDAQIGDILLSIRHLSTVALLDPSAGKFKWLKTGPWLNQHDANLLEDGRYSIFGNDIVRGYDKTGVKYADNKKSHIYIYDPESDTVTTPYSPLMIKERIASKTQGRSRVLSNGDVYIEQTDLSRILRISENKVRWEYVNATSQDAVGALHWSRYLPKNEVDLNWLEDLTCN